MKVNRVWAAFQCGPLFNPIACANSTPAARCPLVHFILSRASLKPSSPLPLEALPNNKKIWKHIKCHWKIWGTIVTFNHLQPSLKSIESSFGLECKPNAAVAVARMRGLPHVVPPSPQVPKRFWTSSPGKPPNTHNLMRYNSSLWKKDLYVRYVRLGVIHRVVLLHLQFL